MNNDRNKELVLDALKDPKYKWRTVRGIASLTKLSEDVVQNLLDGLQLQIVRSAMRSQDGQDLYMLRSRFLKEESPVRKLLGSVKNRID